MTDKNTGIKNTGDWNPGDYNSGDRNSGDRNSGDYNSSDWNSGDWNSGNYNSGDWNSGNYNSGNYNSGYWNSGKWNSGDWNSANRSSGLFNTEEQTIFTFNKDSGKKWDEIDHPHFNEFHLTKWINANNMTDDEKKSEPEFHVRGGYLKQYDYKEAWANFWRDTDEDNRQKFLSLPNFNKDIFKEITGIDIEENNKVKVSCKGKEVEISRESAKALNLFS